jgi:tetratricopeptide (TPR) repeat protein
MIRVSPAGRRVPAPGHSLVALLTASILWTPVLAVSARAVGAQELTHIEGLGALSFPNAGAAEAQHDFVRGVLLLHSFEYGYAAEAFRAAQEADPDFALAYWGEAMTYNHPVWNEKDTEAARSALDRYAPSPEARQAKAPTEREKAYLRAVDVLYGEGQKEQLDTLYAREMERLSADYPDDDEARAFHALALLGLSQGARDIPTYMRAGAIALDVFEKNPDHPGAAHYVIHSFDDPVHAPLAMKAARRYGPMAPDAAHAQHMTTHIFLALGMWDDVVEANLRADAVVDRNLAASGLPQTDCGHYNEWLLYGYQQQGRWRDAEALLMGCYEVSRDERLPEARQRSAALSYAYMRSLNLADTRDAEARPAGTTVDPGASLVHELAQAWGTGMAALLRGDRAEAERRHALIVARADDVPPSYLSPYVPVWRGTLDAAIRMDAGDGESALRAAREAAEFEASLPVDFGPPIAFKPARELEGDILMELGRSGEALTAYSLALARTPNRMRTLLGYARAAAASGRPAVATDAYADLADLLEEADAGLPEAREARAYLARQASR